MTRIKDADLHLWLLLGDAVDRSHAPDQWFAVDWDDSASREKLLECFHSAGVIRVAEHGRKNDAVGDVKVCITCRQAFKIAGAGARSANHARHRQRDDLEGISACIGHRSESREIVLQDFVVCVGGIFFDRADDHVWSDEARDVVDVTVSVVSNDSFAQPQDLCLLRDSLSSTARSLFSNSRGLRFGLSRHCSVVKHTSGSIDLDRAAFHHNPRRKSWQLQDWFQTQRDAVVFLQLFIFVSPRIEDPVVECALAIGSIRKFGP